MASRTTEIKMSSLKSELLYCLPASLAGSLQPALPLLCAISRESGASINLSCRSTNLPADMTLELTVRDPI